MSDSTTHLIGLISDTHGLVRPDVYTALAGVELILHAGDVGDDAILDELALIAPVRAVYGNTDAPGNPRLAESIDLVIGGVSIHVMHGHREGVLRPEVLLARYEARVIVYGHTHRQLVANVGDRWVVNPGAAGHRRFELLPSVATMRIFEGQVEVELIDLAL